MNFRKLSKEKKQQLLLVGMLTVGILAGLGWGLIKAQYEDLKVTARKKVQTQQRLEATQDAIKRSGQIETELAENKKVLEAMEVDTASGDLYAWMLNVLRRFSADYKVEIPQKSGISDPAQVTLLPNFPYKQVSITVMGTGHYHDIGRFVADFENTFPHMRLQNFGMELLPSAGSAEQEMLTFKVEIITLVKTNPS